MSKTEPHKIKCLIQLYNIHIYEYTLGKGFVYEIYKNHTTQNTIKCNKNVQKT